MKQVLHIWYMIEIFSMFDGLLNKNWPDLLQTATKNNKNLNIGEAN